MHITAHLDVDVVAVETANEVAVLLELVAPPAAALEQHPTRTLQVVLDRSGSMARRLDGAKVALRALVDRLDPRDNFGLVIFDDDVELAVPAGPLINKDAVKRAIAAVDVGGTTNLSAGYLRGIQEARRVAAPAGATILLVSDGHANAGVVDPARLEGVAAEAHRNGVNTSTLGYGLGYDEALMSAIARGGTGNNLFADEPDTAIELISGEVEGLLSLAAQAASVHVRLSPRVRSVKVLNELAVTTTPNGLQAELGSFYGDETRKLVLVFDVPGLAALGLAEVATLEFTWVELPALRQHMVVFPIHVNVVPGDQAAGRVPDPVVRSEMVYQRVQASKKRASERLYAGDTEAAMAEIRGAQDAVEAALAADPPTSIAGDFAEEKATLAYLADLAEKHEYRATSKYLRSDSYSRSTKRGRTQRSVPRPPETDGGSES
jgi:Ca-activated chloride channel homolog